MLCSVSVIKTDFFFGSYVRLFIERVDFAPARVDAKNIAGRVPAWNYQTSSAWGKGCL